MIGADFTRPTNLRKYLQAIFNVTTGHDHDGVNSALIASLNPRIQYFQIEDLAAGADIADRVLLECPTGYRITLTSAKIISQAGTIAGIDDGNTCVIKLENGTSNAIVSKTYNTGTAFPVDGTVESLGTLSATYKVIAAGELLTFSITNGSTANTPLFAIQITYTIAAV